MKSEGGDKPSQKEVKNVEAYQKFVKDIKDLVKDSEVHPSSDESIRIELDLLFKKVKGLITGLEDSQKSRCSHKSDKHVHSHCREEQTKSQDQIKKLKELVKKLDK